jgi:hypothetical protein
MRLASAIGMTVVLIANNLDSLGVSFLIKASTTEIAHPRDCLGTISLHNSRPRSLHTVELNFSSGLFNKVLQLFVRNAKTKKQNRYEISHQTGAWYMKSTSTVNLRAGRKRRSTAGLRDF